MKTFLKNFGREFCHTYWKYLAALAVGCLIYEKGHYDGDVWGAECLYNDLKCRAEKHPDRTLEEFFDKNVLLKR